MREIYIVGPFDRFNYGDLIFPLILKYGISRLSNSKYEFKYYSMTGGDYRDKGSIQSEPYSSLIKLFADGSVNVAKVIIAGGESIGADWFNLYRFINIRFHWLTRNILMRKMLSKANILSYIMQGYVEYPFTIDKSVYNRSMKIAYNSVGGTWSAIRTLNELRSADYLAVRENITSKLLNQENIEHDVYPDCAILLSELYPESSFILNNNLRREIREILRSKYVFFQVGRYKYGESLDVIIRQLDEIAKQDNVTIVLCPIGLAPGHEDHIPLSKISKDLKGNNIYIENPHIDEIMALLAHCYTYIGTSLHGIISAMSYSKPYIGLNPNQLKLVGYLQTWGHRDLNEVSEVSGFIQMYDKSKRVRKSELTYLAKTQKELYWQSLRNIYNLFDCEK